MSMFDKDKFGYDCTFDFDHDGKLNFFERSEQLDFYTRPCENDVDEDEEDEVEYALALNGLDFDELEDMDEDERREALVGAGLDPDDFE